MSEQAVCSFPWAIGPPRRRERRPCGCAVPPIRSRGRPTIFGRSTCTRRRKRTPHTLADVDHLMWQRSVQQTLLGVPDVRVPPHVAVFIHTALHASRGLVMGNPSLSHLRDFEGIAGSLEEPDWTELLETADAGAGSRSRASPSRRPACPPGARWRPALGQGSHGLQDRISNRCVAGRHHYL